MEKSDTKKKMKTSTQVWLGILAAVAFCIAVALIVVLPWRSAQKKIGFTLINNGTEYMVNSRELHETLLSGSNYGGKVVIPSEYNGLPVTEIDERFMQNASIKSVTIPDSIKKIGKNAFNNCDKLKSVVIPNGVTHIDTEAFTDCDKLSAVTIPENVYSIGHFAFKNTPACEEENGITYVDKWVMKADETITEAKLREGTVGIAKYAFDQCKTLKKISIPDSVKYVCKNAFRGCINLEYTSDESIKYLGNDQNPYVVCMGTDDKEIAILIIKDGTRVIYGKEDYSSKNDTNQSDNRKSKLVINETLYSFSDCSKLGNNIDIPESVISIGKFAFSTGLHQYVTDPDRIYFGDLSFVDALFGSDYASEHLEEMVAEGVLKVFIYVD